MATDAEIDSSAQLALKILDKSQLVLMYCVSAYPATLEIIDIDRISYMRERYPCHIGFSDHTQSHYAACAAYGAGARWFEKHFTVDKSLDGLDYKYAYDINELSLRMFTF